MAQQTAIDWLLHQVDKYTSGGVQVPNQELSKLITKAKAMEKEQIINAWRDGDNDSMYSMKELDKQAEEYYNETYNKE